MNDRPGFSVRVWDLPTRLFHWSLFALVTASVITGQFDGVLGPATLEWHKRSGLAILTLLLFRLAWGFVGGTHARFASFLRGPREVLAYAKDLVGRTATADPLGHNSLGGWSVMAMLAALALQAGTGLFLVQEDYAFEGPLSRHVSRALSDRLDAIHQANFWVIATLVALHVSAIVFHAVVKRRDLVGGMFSGRKTFAAGREPRDSQGGSLWAGVAVAIASAALVWALVTFA